MLNLTRSEFEAVRKELARELATRRNVYPRWIEAGKLAPEIAAERLRLMQIAYDWVCEQLPNTGRAWKGDQ